MALPLGLCPPVLICLMFKYLQMDDTAPVIDEGYLKDPGRGSPERVPEEIPVFHLLTNRGGGGGVWGGGGGGYKSATGRKI